MTSPDGESDKKQPTPKIKLNLDFIKNLSSSKSIKQDSSDIIDDLFLQDVNSERKRAEDKHIEVMKGKRQTRRERKNYAQKVFWLISIWLIGIFALLVLNGIKWFGGWWLSFNLSDNVLLAVIGGTTINVLGIFIIVMKHLFPDGNKEDKNILDNDFSTKG